MTAAMLSWSRLKPAYRMSAIDTASVVDSDSLESNRLGYLSPAQVRHVYRVGVGSWALNAMFVAATGGLLTYAVPFVWARILLGVATVGTALYMLSRSYDCIWDARMKRVAVVKGRGRPLHMQASALPLGGMLRGDQWRERWEVAGKAWWLPSSALALSGTGDLILYVAPRSHVVVNVEAAKD